MNSRVAQALIALLAVGIFAMVTLPGYRKVEELRRKHADNEQTLKLSAELERNSQSLEDRYNRITDDERARLQKLLPDTLDNVRLVNDMNAIAAQQGLAIRNITVGGEGTPGTTNTKNAAADAASRKRRYGTLSLAFSVTATYDEFDSFLRELERSLRLVDVRSVSVKSSPNRRYDFAVVLETYWLR